MESCGWSQADHKALTAGVSFLKLRMVFSSDPPVSMAILITSPGLVTTGTEGADDIRFISGGALTGNGSVVNGLAGNDTITTTVSGVLTVGGSSDAISVNGGGGADSILVGVDGSTTSANNAVVLGGAGRDTIEVGQSVGAAAAAGFSNIGGGDGGDLMTITTATYSAIGGGAGLDTIELTGTVTIATGAVVAGGAGDDIISGGANVTIQTAAGVFGGGGADTISINSLSTSGSFINGDSSADGGGADSILVGSQATETVVRGKGGADTIEVLNFGSAVIAGNAGGDVIIVSGNFAGDGSVKAGAGADLLDLDEANFAGSALLIAGGGADTIALSGAGNLAEVTMNGGAGADSITFSGAFGSGFGVLAISNLGDSKVGAMDTVDLDGLGGANTAHFDLSLDRTALGLSAAASLPGAIGDVSATTTTTGVLTTTGVGFLTAVGVTGSVTDGAMTFTSEGSAGVSTAATYADAVTLASKDPDAGKSVLFTAGTDEYLFIQGGAAGTDDDYIVKFNGTDGSTFTGAATIELLGD